MKKWPLVLGVVTLLISCVPLTRSEDFLPPEIKAAEAVVDGTAVSLSCTLSEGARTESCGFVYSVAGGDNITVLSEMKEASFAARIGFLAPGMTYEWYAFARAGETEIHSQMSSFKIPEAVIPVPVPAEEPEGIIIPDPFFRRYILENFDSDGDGRLSDEEALIVRKIDVVTDKISSLRGIEHFKNLDSLLCRGADVFEYDDVGHPGMLDSLDVSANHKLRYLACDKNMLRSLDISDNSFLEQVLCSYNLLERIDLSPVPRLRELRMWVNNISTLNLSKVPLLDGLECGGNLITSLDVSSCRKLTTLNIGDLRIKEIALSKNESLRWLGTSGTDIESLDLSHNPGLECLNCFESPISSLDLSQCPRLYELKCWNCKIEELDVSMLPRLKILECSPMSNSSGKNLLTKIYVSEDQEIPGVTLNRSSNNVPEQIEIVVVKPGTVVIPDQAFKAWLVSRFDADLDGELSFSDAANIHEIDFLSNQLGVSSLKGIEHMPELEVLRCYGE